MAKKRATKTTPTKPQLQPQSQSEPHVQRLRDTTLACKVEFNWWGTTKTLSKQQKQEAANCFQADRDIISASKRLVDRRNDLFRRLTSLRNDIRNYWCSRTLPYVEDGTRLIRRDIVERFSEEMAAYRQQLISAVEDLHNNFDQIREDAKKSQGSLYNEHDYPEDIRKLFDVKWTFPSVDPPSYLEDLSPKLYEQEKQRIQAQFTQTVLLIEQAFAAEFHQMLVHLQEKLSPAQDGQKKIFRDSAVTNVQDFFQRFQSMSIGSNKELDNLVSQAELILSNKDPKDLRTNESMQLAIQGQLKSITEQLQGMIVNAPRRSWKRLNPQTSEPINDDVVHAA